MRRILRDESGVTIVEVLVASVVFMVGFSILIGLLNSSLVRFSTQELLFANSLADETMTNTMAVTDTTAMDTVVTRSGLSFRVKRSVSIESTLASACVTIYREKNNRKIIELCNAFIIPEK